MALVPHKTIFFSDYENKVLWYRNGKDLIIKSSFTDILVHYMGNNLWSIMYLTNKIGGEKYKALNKG